MAAPDTRATETGVVETDCVADKDADAIGDDVELRAPAGELAPRLLLVSAPSDSVETTSLLLVGRVVLLDMHGLEAKTGCQ
jgi:hypothetical protein